jgi:hypothetical protein
VKNERVQPAFSQVRDNVAEVFGPAREHERVSATRGSGSDVVANGTRPLGVFDDAAEDRLDVMTVLRSSMAGLMDDQIEGAEAATIFSALSRRPRGSSS